MKKRERDAVTTVTVVDYEGRLTEHKLRPGDTVDVSFDVSAELLGDKISRHGIVQVKTSS